MKAHAVGSIVESICGKCNDVMGHTIMAMVGNEIIKVECRVCKSQHRFRPPVRTGGGKTTVTMKKGREGEPVASRQTAVTQAARPTAKSAPRKAAAAAMAAASAALEKWQTMMGKREGEAPKPYAITEHFSVGDLVGHQSFGNGEVISLIPPDKMDVLFQTGLKRLLRNKA